MLSLNQPQAGVEEPTIRAPDKRQTDRGVEGQDRPVFRNLQLWVLTGVCVGGGVGGCRPPESRWWAKAGVGRILFRTRKGGPLVCGGVVQRWLGTWTKGEAPLRKALNRREKTGFGVSPLSHQEGCCCRAVAQGRRDGQSAR